MMPEFIKQNLEAHGIEYESWDHETVKTSEQASALRDTPLSQGVKSMILYSKKQDKGIAAFVTGDRKIDLAKLREITGLKDLKLASYDRAYQLSGLKVGGISPLGFKTKLDIYIDKHVLDNETIFCSASSETSMNLASKDLLVLHPDAVVDDFTQQK